MGLFAAAEATLADHDMFAAAARRRRGEIIGGDEVAQLRSKRPY